MRIIHSLICRRRRRRRSLAPAVWPRKDNDVYLHLKPRASQPASLLIFLPFVVRSASYAESLLLPRQTLTLRTEPWSRSRRRLLCDSRVSLLSVVNGFISRPLVFTLLQQSALFPFSFLSYSEELLRL